MRTGPMFRKGCWMKAIAHNPWVLKGLTDTDHPPQFSRTFDLGQRKNPDEQEASHELLTVPREKKRRREKDLSRVNPLCLGIFFSQQENPFRGHKAMTGDQSFKVPNKDF
ncbi:unnamed protein product [Paramecium sonneborni]|uniref:Uncharacterized protein n=1 Tax=Paramecium sonneborni TaxID=65129 RepID=A0A8S1NP35_9CILI|nr:unnamed protein product [Paramecium sonneborni]